ncbi:MAG: 30S ribosomal protein S6 [Deltaproteobacteria bacterium]|nr:30S ribosomal protein S6 [Deltaproteobacteria bacterium]
MVKKNFLKKIEHQFPKKYETLIILNPDIEENRFNQFIYKIKDIMSKNGAEFLDLEDWGARKLSYDIKKLNKGKFILVHFSAKGSFIQELERNLRIADDCIRFQTVIFTKDIESKKENKEEAVNE